MAQVLLVEDDGAIRTALTAQQLAVGDTLARAPTTDPREVADVGTALNGLADRIDELIAEERETVADLSHRLRTPLTALRLDAEALTDPEDAERVGNHVNALDRWRSGQRWPRSRNAVRPSGSREHPYGSRQLDIARRCAQFSGGRCR